MATPPSHSHPGHPSGSVSDRDLRRRHYLESLFRAHYPKMYNAARAIGTRNHADAEDAIQTVFHRLLDERTDLLDHAIDSPDRAAATTQLLAYLYGSLDGRMRNANRRDKKQEQLLASVGDLLHPAPLGDPEVDLEQRELARHVQTAYARLSKQERHVFRCRHVFQMSQAATAAFLGISPSTVQAVSGRLCRKLYSALSPHLSVSPELHARMTHPRVRTPRIPPPPGSTAPAAGHLEEPGTPQ